ncbi:MAG: carbon-nitrogen hydrolase family protein [Lentisphaerae bacterium]|nr:carbon-nitrogen hydrolase family protein [Lentisphaerota bacterium]
MAKFINVASIHAMVNERQDEPPGEALRQFREATALLDGTGVDLVVTSEVMIMQQTPETAESIADPGPMLSAYRDFARRNACTIAGVSLTREGSKIYQSIVFYGPEGQYLGCYHKMFPTIQALNKGISPGHSAVVVDTPAGRLGGIICFDLNFDELRDEYTRLAPDILCFASYYHGGHIQANWAFRTHAFFVGAIKDATSDILDPLGRIICSTTYYHRIAWARINLDRFVMHGDGNARKYPDIRRKYKDKILLDIQVPTGLGVLYSLSDEFSAADIAREFELRSAQEFFAAARATRQAKL